MRRSGGRAQFHNKRRRDRTFAAACDAARQANRISWRPAFLAALRAGARPPDAARQAGIFFTTAYAHRRRDAAFCAAWNDALAISRTPPHPTAPPAPAVPVRPAPLPAPTHAPLPQLNPIIRSQHRIARPRPENLLLVSPDALVAQAMVDQLARQGYPCIGVTQIATLATLTIPITGLLIDAQTTLDHLPPLIAGQTTQAIPVLLVCSSMTPPMTSHSREIAWGMIAMPFKHNAVMSALLVARARQREQLTLRERMATLVVQLDDHTAITQAKRLLMQRYALDEGAAYQLLRQYARDRRVRMAEIARRLLAGG